MAIPDYGAIPLAKTWLLVRTLIIMGMIIIVGLTANFVSEIIRTNIKPPSAIIATLVITVIATLYCIISIPFFFARANIGLLIMTGCDGALLLAFVVVAAVVGKPLSYLNCAAVGDASAAANALTASGLSHALGTSIGRAGKALGLADLVGVASADCYETKAIWGLCIALCILFFGSTLLLPAMWLNARKHGLGEKVGGEKSGRGMRGMKTWCMIIGTEENRPRFRF